MKGSSSNSISKILMTTDTLGGVWTYAMVLSEQLGSRGIEIHLATMGRKLSEKQRERASNIPNLHIYESDYKLEWMQEPWADIEKADHWLQELEQEIKPDIIHLNGYAQGSLSWNAPALVVAHSDVYSWHHHVKESEPGAEWETYRQKVERGLQGADQVVAVTQAVWQDLNRHFGFSTEGSVIYNGLTETYFAQSKKDRMVLGLGRIWDEAKNFQLLNEAAAKASVQVAIAGERKHPENGNSNEFENLWLTGSLSPREVRKLLSEAAIYCLPAKYEPFGYTPLEAAFSGCALLLSDITSLREVWKDAALYFDPDDPEDLAEKLEMLLIDEELWNSLSAKAKMRAQNYTAEKMATAYLNLYRYLINDHKQSDKMNEPAREVALAADLAPKPPKGASGG